MKELKYLFAYVVPLSGTLAFSLLGIYSFAGLFVGFVVIPILELLMPGTTYNFTEEEELEEENKSVYDWILYLNVPILYGLLVWYFYLVTQVPLQTYELVGITTTMGVGLGVLGINVAHELGHRDTKFEQFLAKVLLLPNLYMHFFIEHNRGHHVNIATNEDPASSRLNESIYAFYVRSMVGSYLSAWRLEARRLRGMNLSALHWRNQMIWFQLIQATYLIIIGLTLGWAVMGLAIIAGIMGAMLLESVNYIEHYGLRRNKLESGFYERVQPYHSWNSNHVIGRIFLYEVTRHSDHHFKANRKYQVLRHMDSPQLPYGYPCSIIIALCPPLWFAIMNPKVRYYQQQIATTA